MAMILDALIGRYLTSLTDLVHDEIIKLLGLEDELGTLLRKMQAIRFLLKDAERRRFDEESPIHIWLSELKDVMYEVDDIIDLCSINGAQLLADQNSKGSEPSPVCCKFSFSIFSCFTSAPLRHELGNKIKEFNVRLNRLYEDSVQFKLEKSEISETPQITLVNSSQTCSLIEPSAVGGELEVATNELVNRLIAEKVEEKCLVFAVSGMGGVGKTTLAKQIFNHPKIETYFTNKVWVFVSQAYNETELLKGVIRGVNGSYGDAHTTSELLPILRDSVASCHSLFLVLDDVWRADVWLHLFRIPLLTTNSRVRVLVTTRNENVAKVMKAALIYHVMVLSIEESWDMLRRLLFEDHEEQQANDLKELGLNILKKCGGLPIAIKAIAGVLGTREKTRTAWEQILRSDTWSTISDLHENHMNVALHLSFEDLPSHLKQCFLYFSLYGEDECLNSREFARLWVAEGFLSENQENSLMEDVAESYFNELLGRNLLLSTHGDRGGRTVCTMQDFVRSLAIFLSKEETSRGNVNVRNSTTLTKLRRLSVAYYNSGEATEIVDLVEKKGALRTLLAKESDLLLDDERLRWLSCLRVLDISRTEIKKIPDSIGDLVHLRYLDLSWTNINAIPESIKNLAYLQFLNLRHCYNLKQLPNGITQLRNLRYLNLRNTEISFMPKGIEKLQQLNRLRGFPVANMDSSSKLEELNSLKQLRSLLIDNIMGDQSDVVLLEGLPHLSKLALGFSRHVAAELFDKIIPPRSLKTLKIMKFWGPRFPNWMALSSFENLAPNLTVLELNEIESCTQLPPLGQLPELRELEIFEAKKVKQIGQEFLGGGVNSTTRTAFPKLERFSISYMDELEDWSFGAQVEENASPRLKLLPCLQELKISELKLLKHLPKGLKYSAMKSLIIEGAVALKSVDNLPPEIEELELSHNTNLEKVSCLAMLKKLHISCCPALSSVERLDSLQSLKFEDESMESLPDWLLIFLRQWELKNDTNENFFLDLSCSSKAFQECTKEGCYWNFIQHIPRVTVRDFDGGYLHYDKMPNIYMQN